MNAAESGGRYRRLAGPARGGQGGDRGEGEGGDVMEDTRHFVAVRRGDSATRLVVSTYPVTQSRQRNWT